MNASMQQPERLVSIRTPFNKGIGKTERRMLRNGHWVRPDPKACAVLAWLKGGGK